MKQIRWTSKAAWVVLISSTAIILGYFVSQETVTVIEGVLGAILVVLEAFGVFNNPTDKDSF